MFGRREVVVRGALVWVGAGGGRRVIMQCWLQDLFDEWGGGGGGRVGKVLLGCGTEDDLLGVIFLECFAESVAA